MTNTDLKTLNKIGFVDIDYSMINPASQYYVYKFLREFDNKIKTLQEETLDIFKKTLGEDFNKVADYEAGDKVISESEYKSLISKVIPLINELNKQEVTFSIKPINANDFFDLMSSNLDVFEKAAKSVFTENFKIRKMSLYNDTIDALKGILWEEPTNDEK